MQLAESLGKNCGTKVHREIASRPFTQAILQLVNDRVLFLIDVCVSFRLLMVL